MATTSTVHSLPQITSFRSSAAIAPVQSLSFVRPSRRGGSGAIGARMDFIGSPTNLIMVTSTSLMLFAGRFGLAPSANKKSTAGLKLEARDSGLQSNDPAGFTLADTVACGVVGHIMGVGIVMAFKYLGVI